MNAQTNSQSRNGAIVAVIGFLVILFGTATDNALLMLVASAVGFVALLIIDRQRWGQSTWLTLMVSATIAAVAAIAITISGS